MQISKNENLKLKINKFFKIILNFVLSF